MSIRRLQATSTRRSPRAVSLARDRRIRCQAVVAGLLIGALLVGGGVVGRALAHGRLPAVWWLRVLFPPSHAAYENLSVADISPQWTAATFLSFAALPPEAERDIAWMEEYNLTFRRDGGFNGDGREDRVLVGTYREISSGMGRFFLILERDGPRRWRKAFLQVQPGSPGFSVIYEMSGQLAWGFCLECDDVLLLDWRAGVWFLDKPPED